MAARVALLLAAVAAAVVAQNPTSCLGSDPAAGTDVFPEKWTALGTAPEYFSVEYKNTYKLVTFTGSDGSTSTYVLYQCGTTQPSGDGIPAGARFFPVPVADKKAITGSTTVTGFLGMLGRLPALGGVTSPNLFPTGCMQKLVADGTITGLNDTTLPGALTDATVLFGAFGTAGGEKGVGSNSFSEKSLMQKAQWLGFYSLFFNEEKEAMDLVKTINSNLECFKANSQQAVTAAGSKVKVAWVSYSAGFGGSPPSFSLMADEFKVDLVTGAGGEVVKGAEKKTSFATAAELHAAIKDADVVIDQSFNLYDYALWKTTFEFTDSSDFKFIKNKKVFTIGGLQSASGNLDWFAVAPATPDAVLQDLSAALYPDTIKDAGKHWFANMAADTKEITTITAECPADLATAEKNRASQCVAGDLKTTDKNNEKASASSLSIGAAAVLLGALAVV